MDRPNLHIAANRKIVNKVKNLETKNIFKKNSYEVAFENVFIPEIYFHRADYVLQFHHYFMIELIKVMLEKLLNHPGKF